MRTAQSLAKENVGFDSSTAGISGQRAAGNIAPAEGNGQFFPSLRASPFPRQLPAPRLESVRWGWRLFSFNLNNQEAAAWQHRRPASPRETGDPTTNPQHAGRYTPTPKAFHGRPWRPGQFPWRAGRPSQWSEIIRRRAHPTLTWGADGLGLTPRKNVAGQPRTFKVADFRHVKPYKQQQKGAAISSGQL